MKYSRRAQSVTSASVLMVWPRGGAEPLILYTDCMTSQDFEVSAILGSSRLVGWKHCGNGTAHAHLPLPHSAARYFTTYRFFTSHPALLLHPSHHNYRPVY